MLWLFHLGFINLIRVCVVNNLTVTESYCSVGVLLCKLWIMGYHKNSGTSLNFKRTYWEFPGGKTYGYRLPLMQLDEETGLPDFLSVEQVRKKGSFSEKRFHILSQQLENGKTIYAYINKSDPHKFLLVTCVDGYVAHVLDNNGIFTYDDYGTRSE